MTALQVPVAEPLSSLFTGLCTVVPVVGPNIAAARNRFFDACTLSLPVPESIVVAIIVIVVII